MFTVITGANSSKIMKAVPALTEILHMHVSDAVQVRYLDK